MFALTLGQVLGLDLFALVLGAIIPDFDYLFGITHRTMIHSLLFVIILSFISIKKNKRVGTSLFIGLSSHLLLDVLTTQGVMLLWPLNTFFSYGLFNSMDNSVNLLFVLMSLIILWNKDIIQHKLSNIGYKKVQTLTFSVLLIPIIFVIPYYYLQINSCSNVLINELNKEECVNVNGRICSEITTYTSNSGNDYDIFTLCDKESNIQVWLLNSINPGIHENDSVNIIGDYTLKFDTPEIYMIKHISIE